MSGKCLDQKERILLTLVNQVDYKRDFASDHVKSKPQMRLKENFV